MTVTIRSGSSLSHKTFPCYGLGPLCRIRPVTRAPGLSMFFPAYNDAGTIASLVIQARASRSAS